MFILSAARTSPHSRMILEQGRPRSFSLQSVAAVLERSQICASVEGSHDSCLFTVSGAFECKLTYVSDNLPS